MSTTTKAPPPRHPSTAIGSETISELAYRVYLSRLEPPMTPKQSLTAVKVDAKGRVTDNDAKRRVRSLSYEGLVRAMLRQAYDLGLVKLPESKIESTTEGKPK